MAAASTLNSDFEFELAQKEKAAVRYIDLFINSKQDRNVLLASLQEHISTCPLEIRDYVGHSEKEVENFIKSRTHLWKLVLNENISWNLVKSRTIPERKALQHILKYVQEKSQGTTYSTRGAKLQDLSSEIGEKDPWLKEKLGRGFDGIKSFLLSHPNLFAMMDPDTVSLDNVRFVNKASLIADTIVLFEQNSGQLRSRETDQTEWFEENYDSRDQSEYGYFGSADPNRLEGIGRIVKYVPEAFYGFLRDDRNSEVIYFAGHSVQGIEEKDLRWQMKLAQKYDQKFRYIAFVSQGYKVGWRQNKWRTDRMWAEESNSKLQLKSKATGESPLSNRMCASGFSEKKTAGRSIENDYQPRSFLVDEGTSERQSKKSSKEEIDRPRSSKTSAQEKSIAIKNQADLSRAESTTPENSSMARMQKSTPYNEDPIRLVPKADDKVSTKISLEKNYPSISTNLSNFSASTSKVTQSKSSSLTQSQKNLKKSASKVTAMVEKCDFGCQTEFNDDRELLLRVLRQSPDLLKLVSVFREPSVFGSMSKPQ